MRPQRTQQSKNAVELASADVYDIALNSDAPTAFNRDRSFRSDIAYKAKEILNAAGIDNSDSALLPNPLKITVHRELEVQVRSYKSLMQS